MWGSIFWRDVVIIENIDRGRNAGMVGDGLMRVVGLVSSPRFSISPYVHRDENLPVYTRIDMFIALISLWHDNNVYYGTTNVV
jgi:hypothetical protein